MGPVLDFPLPPERAADLIRDLYAAGKVRLPTPPGGAWERVVTVRQMMSCLERGEITDGPKIDQRGNYLYELRRLSAGVAVIMQVVLLKENDEWVLRIVGVRHE